MILKSVIAEVVSAQAQQLNIKKDLIVRSYTSYLNLTTTHIDVITGIRRCGKSTLLKQLTTNLNAPVAFVNFEDPRLFGFELNDFARLDDVLRDDYKYYYFDEIQNVDNWELFVRQLHDRQKKIFLTGSNASLLSKELGTRLTGRHIAHELFPFSYIEFLDFTGQKSGENSFNEYLSKGGFPEYLLNNQIEILQLLLKDIVLRDIAIRHNIRNTDTLMMLTLFLITNVGKEHTYNRLKNNFNIGSANTVADYMAWLSDAYLLFYLPKFSYSATTTSKNARKVYAIDTGLIQANTLGFSADSGRILENAVYLHLRRSKLTLFYFNEGKECDFVVFDKGKCMEAIQVCTELHNMNMDRELSGLLAAMKQFNLSSGTIVTKNQEDTLVFDNLTVNLVPAFKYMV